jgi:hypothetical protein
MLTLLSTPIKFLALENLILTFVAQNIIELNVRGAIVDAVTSIMLFPELSGCEVIAIYGRGLIGELESLILFQAQAFAD